MPSFPVAHRASKTIAILALSASTALGAAACAAPTASPSATPPAAASAAPSATPVAAVTAPASTPGAGTTAAPPTGTAPARPTAPAATVTPNAVTATANPTIAGGLVGLWQGNNNSFYLLNLDGTWDWDQHGDKVLTASENQGRWWMEGDVLHIQDLAGKAPCPAGQIGAYQAALTGDSLVLTVVKDDCGPRVDQTAGQYQRLPAGP